MAEIATNVAISIISKLGSSDHKTSFPGNGLTPSQITCGLGNNILHVAAKYKGSYEVKVLLDYYPSLALEPNAKGDTPLHLAARLGKSDVVTCLVEGPKPHTYERFEVEAEYRNLLKMVNHKRNTALHEAVLNGNCDVAELLIKADATLTSFDNEAGESPLFLAVDAGYKKIALSILETFPGCSLSGRNGMTVMHAAVIRAKYRNIDKPLPTIAHLIRSIFKHDDDHFVSKLLEKCGSEILEIPDEFGWMPHHYAANMGISGILKRILEKNSSLAYIQDKEGISALHVSAKNGHIDVIKTLIKKCPDVCELLDKKGRTALHIAVEHKQVFALHAILNTMAFDDLLNEQDEEGNTALHLACIYGHYKIIIPLLVDPRTNKRIINKKGMTAFDIINRSGILGPFDKFMIKSEWKVKNPNSLLEANAVRDTRELRPEMTTSQETDPSKTSKNPKNDQSVKNTASVNLVVATIIASITFAAAMGMPGGYDGSTGFAHFRKHTSFRYFLAFDSLAFGCSAASMVMHFALGLQSKLRGEAYKYPIHLITLLTFLSITSTVLAFVMGTYTVLYEKKSEHSSDSGFGLPGNIAFAAFLATLLYFFLPLLMAFQNYVAGALVSDSEARVSFINMFSKLFK